MTRGADDVQVEAVLQVRSTRGLDDVGGRHDSVGRVVPSDQRLGSHDERRGRVGAEFPPSPRQDYSNIPIQQKGMHAKGFEFMRLSKNVEGMISNYQRILDGYLAGVPIEKLAKATNVLGGNFDGQIAELGF